MADSVSAVFINGTTTSVSCDPEPTVRFQPLEVNMGAVEHYDDATILCYDRCTYLFVWFIPVFFC